MDYMPANTTAEKHLFSAPRGLHAFVSYARAAGPQQEQSAFLKHRPRRVPFLALLTSFFVHLCALASINLAPVTRESSKLTSSCPPPDVAPR